MSMKLVKYSDFNYGLIVSKGNIPSFVKTVVPVPLSNGNEIMIACVDHHDPSVLRISLKNCKAIERGYDLDNEANRFMASGKTIGGGDSGWIKSAFKEGFQKAIELMVDKKFTEDDIRKAYFQGEKDSCVKGGHTKDMSDEFIQSLYQNKWEVAIVTEDNFTPTDEKYIDEVGSGNFFEHSKKPKFDQDGCVILRRS
jgi:hypothetical protein